MASGGFSSVVFHALLAAIPGCFSQVVVVRVPQQGICFNMLVPQEEYMYLYDKKDRPRNSSSLICCKVVDEFSRSSPTLSLLGSHFIHKALMFTTQQLTHNAICRLHPHHPTCIVTIIYKAAMQSGTLSTSLRII